MKFGRILSFAAVSVVCVILSACNVRFGFVDESSSSQTEQRKDDSFISEILEKGYDATDSGESYHLDGDFSMFRLYSLHSASEDVWNNMTNDERHDEVMNLLNFWAYYGDDASIRFLPSQLENGITEKLGSGSENVLDAALEFAVPGNEEKYLAIIGIIDIDDVVDTDESSE